MAQAWQIIIFNQGVNTKVNGLKKVIQKYKDFILYVLFGVATTLVNIISYYIFTRAFLMCTFLSNIFAWILSVAFAYLTNRKWVFNSQARTYRDILIEVSSFVSCRLLTGGLDLAIMVVGADLLGFPDMIVKCLSNIIVILSNYAASKFIIFRKKRHS